jgi:Tfp pilus assembly protein PilV
MNRLLTAVVTTGAICLALQALAADSDNQSTMSERQQIAQIVGCMRVRLSANKDSSYKDAFKACRKQVIKGDNLQPDAVEVSGAQPKP